MNKNEMFIYIKKPELDYDVSFKYLYDSIFNNIEDLRKRTVACYFINKFAYYVFDGDFEKEIISTDTNDLIEMLYSSLELKKETALSCINGENIEKVKNFLNLKYFSKNYKENKKVFVNIINKKLEHLKEIIDEKEKEHRD